jgi:hypothetical protein
MGHTPVTGPPQAAPLTQPDLSRHGAPAPSARYLGAPP